MTLYIQDENYHFDGYISGVVIDEENNKISLFYKEGISENELIKLSEDIEWYELDKFSIKKNKVEVSAKGFEIYKKFFCLNILPL